MIFVDVSFKNRDEEEHKEQEHREKLDKGI